MSGDSRLGSLEGILSSRKARPRLSDITGAPAEAPDVADAPAPAVAPDAGTPSLTVVADKPVTPRPKTNRRGSADQKSTASRKRAEPASAKVPSAQSARVRVVLRLDTDLRDKLADAASSKAVSLAEVVFDAIEAAVESGRFPDMLQRPTAPEPAAPVGLFTRTTARRAQPKVTVELRMTSSDQTVLDNLVREHDAASRTQLITSALSSYLD